MEQDIQKMWDLKANAYYADQKNHRTNMTQRVIHSLERRTLLPCKKLLDVGGGSGRYAIPLAFSADSVTVTDISSNMLQYASEYAKESKTPDGKLEYVQLDWQTADLPGLGWHKAFDLVFASMSPAVKTKEGLDRMIEASCGWCCAAQYIDSTDNVEMEISAQTKSDLSGPPHRDRNFVDWLFHSLWLRRLNPWVEYIEEELDQTLTVREAKLRYERRYNMVIKNQGVSLDEILAAVTHEDRIKVWGKTTLALVLWEAK